MLDFSGMRNLNAQEKTKRTQQSMCDQVGFDTGRYSKLMKGGEPSKKEIDMLCYLFNCEVGDIVKHVKEESNNV